MYTILYTPRCMEFATKLADRLGESTVLLIDDVLKDPTKLGDFKNLGLVYNSEGKIMPADTEDLILDVLANHPSFKNLDYLFSICLTDGRSVFGLKVVERLCMKIGFPPCLSLTFPIRTRNEIDLDKAVYHISSRHYLTAGSDIMTTIYMTRYGVLTGGLRAGKKKIIEPHIDVFETTKRLTRWSIGLPLLILGFLFPIVALIVFKGFGKLGMMMNVISYTFMLLLIYIISKYILKFPFKRLLTQNRSLSFSNFFAGFIVMLVLCIATNLIWMAIRSGDFSRNLGEHWPKDFLLSTITVFLQTISEIIICISYVVFFRNDSMPKGKKEKLLCCIFSGALFIAFHGRAWYSIIISFMTGFALTAVSLSTNGMEIALGIRIADKLVTALLFTYTGAPLSTKALLKQENKVGPMLILQTAFCLVTAIIVALCYYRKKEQKNS